MLTNSAASSARTRYIGLMSGTSLDGVDGVLASFHEDTGELKIQTEATAYLPFDDRLRADLLSLQQPGENEIEREALAANALASCYARCVAFLLDEAQLGPDAVRAIGAHGQTIRHRPELGFTRQTGNPALLAELTGIDVIADFRSRDIAAGGQGAPLVPAFHRAAFGAARDRRVIVNIGGIANISILPGQEGELAANPAAAGFDTGPGNVLMDHWTQAHLGKPYDEGGQWAATGRCLPELLDALQSDPYFALPPPKSTGRDLFHPAWLDAHLARHPNAAPADVQATLTELTAMTIAQAIATHASDTAAVYLCGGGARNTTLASRLAAILGQLGSTASVQSTQELGMAPSHVEPLAFAWLARRFITGQAGNLHQATGARGPRLLGALYPA